jgi:hypothetical protein
MARAKKSCLPLTNWAFGSLISDINTLSNKYWSHCQMNIEYRASVYQTRNYLYFFREPKLLIYQLPQNFGDFQPYLCFKSIGL